MSWAQCFSGSNNIHFNFPPILSDGRNYASWQPEAVINERIQKKENINSNWAYRQFLTHNGLDIMNLLENVKFLENLVTLEKRYELLLCFNRIRREFRNEKLLILFIFHFIFVSSEFHLENISFM